MSRCPSTSGGRRSAARSPQRGGPASGPAAAAKKPLKGDAHAHEGAQPSGPTPTWADPSQAVARERDLAKVHLTDPESSSARTSPTPRPRAYSAAAPHPPPSTREPPHAS